MRIMWEGPFFRPLSLDKVNRETVMEGLGRGHEVLIRVSDPSIPSSYENHPLRTLVSGGQPVDWHIRHRWPPYWTDRTGPLIVYQAWESGAIPDEWVPLLNGSETHKLVVYSEAVKEMFLYSGVNPKKISVVPLGINPTIFHPYGAPLELTLVRSKVILWVGGLIPRKGLDILLTAYRRAFHHDDDVTLLIKTVGQNTAYHNEEVPRLLNEARMDPDSPHILVLDQDLSETQMAGLYRRADVLVSPYRGEGFNLPVLEAMASGTLVVASDTNPTNEFLPETIGWRIPGSRQYFKVAYSHKDGWLFHCDPDALASILREVVGLSPEEADLRRQRAQHHIQENYTWRHVWRRWEQVLATPAQSTSPTRAVFQNSIIWRGPIRNASGYASDARAFLKQLPIQGILPRIIDESAPWPAVVSDQEDSLLQSLEQLRVPESAVMIHSVPGHALFRRRRGIEIARTFFETDRIPADWTNLLQKMDAVMVASPFNAQTFSESGVDSSKIRIVPSPVDVQQFVPAASPQSNDRFRFISVFDWSYRKGWDILTDAWYKAFTDKDPVVLILKLTNIVSGDTERELHHFFSQRGISTSKGAPVQVINENWSEETLVALYQSSDAFVLPTRGEGWGRPILEAMACNLPVIVTQWGAPADYLTDTNSYPVRVKQLSRISDSYPISYYRGHYWAEPDVDHLVSQLRSCFNNGNSNLQGIRATALEYSPDKAASRLVNVLQEFGVREPKLR